MFDSYPMHLNPYRLPLAKSVKLPIKNKHPVQILFNYKVSIAEKSDEDKHLQRSKRKRVLTVPVLRTNSGQHVVMRAPTYPQKGISTSVIS